MKAKLKWEDLFNHELLVQKGDYCFHRFYHDPDKAPTVTLSGRNIKMYIKPADLKGLPIIALGITGFLIFEREENYFTSLKSKLEKNIDFCTEDIYKEYFEHCFSFDQLRNKKLPNPVSFERAEKLFIPVHIREEELKLEESKKFFEEYDSLEVEKINSQLKEFANGYIKCLKELNNSFDVLISGISKSILVAIFNKYKDDFVNESIDSWLRRFHYQSTMKIPPIDVDSNAREGTNRLILLAILSFVQSCTGNDFVFEKFVYDRFGIKSFQKTKSLHNNKNTYKEVLTKCNRIAEIMA